MSTNVSLPIFGLGQPNDILYSKPLELIFYLPPAPRIITSDFDSGFLEIRCRSMSAYVGRSAYFRTGRPWKHSVIHWNFVSNCVQCWNIITFGLHSRHLEMQCIVSRGTVFALSGILLLGIVRLHTSSFFSKRLQHLLHDRIDKIPPFPVI